MSGRKAPNPGPPPGTVKPTPPPAPPMKRGLAALRAALAEAKDRYAENETIPMHQLRVMGIEAIFIDLYNRGLADGRGYDMTDDLEALQRFADRCLDAPPNQQIRAHSVGVKLNTILKGER